MPLDVSQEVTRVQENRQSLSDPLPKALSGLPSIATWPNWKTLPGDAVSSSPNTLPSSRAYGGPPPLPPADEASEQGENDRSSDPAALDEVRRLPLSMDTPMVGRARGVSGVSGRASGAIPVGVIAGCGANTSA